LGLKAPAQLFFRAALRDFVKPFAAASMTPIRHEIQFEYEGMAAVVAFPGPENH
jgi:hypothetical protein